MDPPPIPLYAYVNIDNMDSLCRGKTIKERQTNKEDSNEILLLVYKLVPISTNLDISTKLSKY